MSEFMSWDTPSDLPVGASGKQREAIMVGFEPPHGVLRQTVETGAATAPVTSHETPSLCYDTPESTDLAGSIPEVFPKQ